MAKSVKKKINVRLPYYIYRLFDSFAFQKGIPKSKLIRKWLNEANSLHVNVCSVTSKSTDKNVNFCFQLSTKNNDLLENLVNNLDMSTNSFIKFLILSNIESRQNKEQEGYNSTEKLDQLNLQELYTIKDEVLTAYTRKLLRRGYFNRSEEIFQILENKLTANSPTKQVNLSAQLNILKAYFHTHNTRNTFKSLEYLEKAQSLALNLKDRNIIGEVNYNLCELYSYFEDIPRAIDYGETVLDYIDIYNQPELLTDTYILLAFMYHQIMQPRKSEEYFCKVKKLLGSIKFEDDYQKTSFLTLYSLKNFHEGDVDEVRQLAKKYEAIAYNSKSKKVKTYNHHCLGKVYLLEGDFSKAYRCFSKAEKQEISFRPDSLVHRSSLMKVFIESRRSFDNSNKLFQKNLEYSKNKFQPDLIKYLMYSSQYLQSSDRLVKNTGIKNLKMLADNANYPLIRSSAKKTLENKRLFTT